MRFFFISFFFFVLFSRQISFDHDLLPSTTCFVLVRFFFFAPYVWLEIIYYLHFFFVPTIVGNYSNFLSVRKRIPLAMA